MAKKLNALLIIVGVLSVVTIAGIVIIQQMKSNENKWVELTGRYAVLSNGSGIFINDDCAILLKKKSFKDVNNGDVVTLAFKDIDDTFPAEVKYIKFVAKVADGNIKEVLELPMTKKVLECGYTFK